MFCINGKTGAAVVLLQLLAPGCSYHYYTGDLRPTQTQAPLMSVADDGTVSHSNNGFEVAIKPMTTAELDRLYADRSRSGPQSTNPFTFGDTEFWGEREQKQRFQVFRLRVVNEVYPKVKIDPSKVVIRATNGRTYWSLGFEQLDTYFRAYATGYQGNEYLRYEERRDLLQRSMFENKEIFVGQASEGFVLFETLDMDVGRITAVVEDIVIRYDFRNEPVETMELSFGFEREIGREYGDGRRERR